MTPEEELKQYMETGNLVWIDGPDSEVKWVGGIDPVDPDPIFVTVRTLLPILNIDASREKKKNWIRKACAIVGTDKFVYDSALKSELDHQKRNLWFNDVIEQVIIQSAYHRLEKHKIPSIKKDFEKKRRRLIAKMVAARLNGDTGDTMGMLFKNMGFFISFGQPKTDKWGNVIPVIP